MEHSTVLPRTSADGDMEQSSTSLRVWPGALEPARGVSPEGTGERAALVSAEKTNLHLSQDTLLSPHILMYQTQDK